MLSLQWNMQLVWKVYYMFMMVKYHHTAYLYYTVYHSCDYKTLHLQNDKFKEEWKTFLTSVNLNVMRFSISKLISYPWELCKADHFFEKFKHKVHTVGE